MFIVNRNNTHQIQNDKIWKDVNEKNKMLLNDYIIELKSRKRKESTITQYLKLTKRNPIGFRRWVVHNLLRWILYQIYFVYNNINL